MKPKAILPPWTPTGDRDEHDARIRELCEIWDRPCLPCNCGYFPPDYLVTCSADERVKHCIPEAQTRLARHYKRVALDEVRGRRKFPGVPFPKAERGTCKWCGKPVNEGKRTLWHGDCLYEFFLHTRREDQVAFVLQRDGVGCKLCGKVEGAWSKSVFMDDVEERRKRWTWFDKTMPPGAGAFQIVNWITALELDHKIALGRVAMLPDDERRVFFGPLNLQLICSTPCHKLKTAEDIRLIAPLRAERRGNVA